MLELDVTRTLGNHVYEYSLLTPDTLRTQERKDE